MKYHPVLTLNHPHLGTRQPILILEELARLSTKRKSPSVEELSMEIKHQFHHWLLRYPVQCVMTAEAIMWERGMTRLLEKQDKDDLRMLRYDFEIVSFFLLNIRCKPQHK